MATTIANGAIANVTVPIGRMLSLTGSGSAQIGAGSDEVGQIYTVNGPQRLGPWLDQSLVYLTCLSGLSYEVIDPAEVMPASTLTADDTDKLKAGNQDKSARLALVNPTLSNDLWPITLPETSETITVAQGPSVATGGQITAEYNALKTGRREIAFRSDAERAANAVMLKRITARMSAPAGVAQFATAIGTTPNFGSGGFTGWASNGLVAFRLLGDEVTIVYGDNNGNNSAQILVDGKKLVGSNSAGILQNGVSSSNHSPQWTRLTFADRRRRTIVARRATIQALILKPGDQVEAYPFAGKAIILGDSHGNRTVSAGDTAILPDGMLTYAVESLGYQAVNLALGSTGFANTGGGWAASRDNYSGLMALWSSQSGVQPTDYSLVVLQGSGNDFGTVTSAAQYKAVIDQALATFPAARVVCTSVYEGFNSASTAATLNSMLKTACEQAGSARVTFVPIDSANHPEGLSMWFGHPGYWSSPAGLGNADVFLGTGTSGADAHANAAGLAFGSDFIATEMIRCGIPYAVR